MESKNVKKPAQGPVSPKPEKRSEPPREEKGLTGPKMREMPAKDDGKKN